MEKDISPFSNPQTVVDRTTFEAPNRYPEGILNVIVNGQLSVEKKRTAALAGRRLRGPGYRP